MAGCVGKEVLTGDIKEEDCEVLEEEVLDEEVLDRFDFLRPAGTWLMRVSGRRGVGGGINPGCCDVCLGLELRSEFDIEADVRERESDPVLFWFPALAVYIPASKSPSSSASR